MAYWLIKTEPETFSWDQQVQRGAKGEPWTGVRNHQAKLNLKAMKRGDLAFFYHSNIGKQIVGPHGCRAARVKVGPQCSQIRRWRTAAANSRGS